MKKIILSIFLATLMFTSCEKSKAQNESAKVTTPETTTPALEPVLQVDPEIEKLTQVLAKMSDGAKNSMPNGDAKELLADLKKVLAADTDDLLILCDKTHPIGPNYVPTDIVPLVSGESYAISRNNLSLRKPAYESLKKMASAAKAEGISLLASSTYRTYEYQVTVYNRLVKLQGQEITDRESARPGTSQHQLGTVIDFGSIDDAYAETKACKWLNEHAEDYGWSLSFPQGYEEFTGYRWECWHFRYIGVEACKFQKKWFNDIQQFMLEFIYYYKQVSNS